MKKYNIEISEKLEDGEAMIVTEFEASEETVISILANQINADLEEGPIEEKPVSKKQVHKKYRHKRKTIVCKKCGEEGHQARTCTQVKTVTKVSHKEDSKDSIEDGALTRMQYSMVRERKHQEVSSSKCAEDMEVDEEEVRYAFSSLTYDGYLSLRR